MPLAQMDLKDSTKYVQPDLKDPIEYVQLLVDVGALLYGEFTLASGKSSTYYFDSKPLTLDPEGAYVVASYFLEKISVNVVAVGGMALGAIPIVSNVAMLSRQSERPLPAFFVRKEAKTHGTKNLIEGNLPEDTAKPVAILDDVVTGGGSILQAINAVEDAGNPITDVMCILDRSEGGREVLKERGYTLRAMYTMVDGQPRFNQ